jgi:hypothetical protein
MIRSPGKLAEKIAYLRSHPGETSRDEVELVDGTVLDRYSAPVLDAAGNNLGRIWTFRDITARKRAENALLESKNLLESVVENVPLMIEGGGLRLPSFRRSKFPSCGPRHSPSVPQRHKSLGEAPVKSFLTPPDPWSCVP